MNYSFNTDHAVKYGLDEAVMLHNLLFWLAKNKANDSHIHDGKVWTFNSASAFAKLFPFWNPRKIARILLSLESQGAIESGCYNKAGYDKTKWYSSPLLDSLTNSVQSNDQICPIDTPDLSNRLTSFVQPIPDSKQQIENANSKQERSSPSKSENQLRIEKLFNKRVTTPMDRSERLAWATAKDIVADLTEGEWVMLETYYAAPQHMTYSRKTLATLLNNLSGELDKAADWARQHTNAQRKISTPTVWS